jgi:predicted nucleic acid-binding protein
MKAIFVDTSHFVAVFNPSDQWHASALEVETQLQQVKRVTTELVLVEVLNYFAAYRQDVKKNIARAIRRWLESASVETVLHTHGLFEVEQQNLGVFGRTYFEQGFITNRCAITCLQSCAV